MISSNTVIKKKKSDKTHTRRLTNEQDENVAERTAPRGCG